MNAIIPLTGHINYKTKQNTADYNYIKIAFKYIASHCIPLQRMTLKFI